MADTATAGAVAISFLLAGVSLLAPGLTGGPCHPASLTVTPVPATDGSTPYGELTPAEQGEFRRALLNNGSTDYRSSENVQLEDGAITFDQRTYRVHLQERRCWHGPLLRVAGVVTTFVGCAFAVVAVSEWDA